MNLRSYWIEGIMVAAILVGLGLAIAVRNKRRVPVPVPRDAATLTVPKQTGPKISQDNRIQILVTFERGLMYSQDQSRRQDELCGADPECRNYRDNARKVIGEWNQLVARVVQEEKLPPGTGFNVDTGTGTVNVVVPTIAPNGSNSK